MIKRILIGLSALLILFLGAVLILPGLVPTDTYRSRLEADLSQAFARDVKISGDIDITTFPALKLETGAVSLANPEGFPEGQFVNIEGLSAKVKLWPLLSKRVEISGVTLVSPAIRLEKQADGRANWTGKEAQESVEEDGTGPFKRDGRFTEYDPALTLLRIESGTVQYIDASSEQDIKVENINLDLRAPGLNQPLRLNGEFLVDGLNTVIDAGIDSPADFLNGLTTGFSGDITTPEGEVDITGQFLANENIAFTGNFDASSAALTALAERLPMPEDLVLPALTSVSAKGEIAYGPTSTKFPTLEFAAEGDGMNASFNGSVDLTNGVKSAGVFSAKLDDLTIIQPYLEEPIEALNLLSSMNAQGEIAYGPNLTKISGLEFAAQGDGIDASFNGNVDLSEGATSTGLFSAKLDDVSIIQPLLEEPVEALNVLSTANAQGNVSWSGKTFTLTNIQSAITGSDLTANFTGNAAFDETLSLTGTFDGETANVPALVENAGLSQPDAAALKRLSAQGLLTFVDGKAQISELIAEASEGLLNGKYSGEFTYGESIGLNGQFSGEISDLKALDAALPREIPYSDIAKRITIASQIQSSANSYTFTGLSAKLLDGLLNGDFDGRLKVGEASDISGTLTVSSESLRGLATAQNVLLPPSTEVGAIFENFALSGQVTGTPEKMTFNSGKIELDALSGQGDFNLAMDGAKPMLTGALALSPLDLRPYMAAWSEQKPTGAIMPWSEAPITLTGLEAIDAEVDITAPSITLDRLALGQTVGEITLKAGTLTADLQKMELYGGSASGKYAMKSDNGVPTITLDTAIESVAAQNFFMASGGFDKVTGTSDFDMSFTGSGQSQAAIMKSLTGGGTFKVLSGQLLGLDVGSLISGVDQALTTRALPQNIGLGGSTNFNDIDSKFTLTNGRATLSGFEFQSGSFHMDADGFIDIGQQTIDFGIRPKLTGGSDLANFGIPLRFTGGFGKAKAGLDTSFLTTIATAKAREKASSLVQDQISGTAGSILGSVIGGNTSSTTTPATETTTPQGALGSILGGVLGGNTSPTTAPAESSTQDTPPAEEKATVEEETIVEEEATAEDPETPEEQIGNALKGLFGTKKKE